MCDCLVCKRSRKFHRIVDKLKSKSDRKWLEDLFNHLYEVESEIEFQTYIEDKEKL